MSVFLAILKMFLLVVICLITIPLITISRIFFSETRFKHIIARLFHSALCLVFGIKYQIKGDIEKNKQVLFVGNHLSYLDIPLLGSFLNATFISKDDVQGWPIFGFLATMAKTIFISRDPSKAQKVLTDMQNALDTGKSLIVFPEGTSGSGKEILPFKSSLFNIFLQDQIKKRLVIQTFTTNITKVDGKAVSNDKDRDLYAWYGDMDLTPHIWALAKTKGVEMSVTFHPARSLENYTNRKVLSADCYKDVANGLNA